jgi:hypothetical protein
MNRPFNNWSNTNRRQAMNQRVGRGRVSNKNVAIWLALGLLYFFVMPVAIILLVGLFYIGKVQVAFKWKHYLMPALGLLAIATFFLPQAYKILSISTFVLIILYFCGRFKMRMR